MLQLALYGVACERRLSCSLRADCEIGCEMVQSTGDTVVFLSVSLFQRIGAALFNLSLKTLGREGCISTINFLRQAHICVTSIVCEFKTFISDDLASQGKGGHIFKRATPIGTH